MKIRLSEVHGGTGSTFAETIAADAIEWGESLAVRVVAPLQVAIKAVRIPGTLVVTGSIRTEIECRCSRCDETFRCPVEEPRFECAWELTMDGLQWVRRLEDEGVEDMHKQNGEKGLHHSRAGHVDVESVDLTEDVREAMILAFPAYPVCRPGCKGLCATCGQDLNKATCGCAPPEDNRWGLLDRWSAQ